MKQHRKTFTLVAALIILAAVAYIRYGQSPDRAKGSVAIVEGSSSPTAHQHIPENNIAAKINAPSDVVAAPKPFPADGLTKMLRFDSEKKFYTISCVMRAATKLGRHGRSLCLIRSMQRCLHLATQGAMSQ